MVAALPLLYYTLWFGRDLPSFVVIKQGNSPAYTESLAPARHMQLQGLLGESIVETDGRRARFVSSPCPTQVCVQAGWLEHAGEFAACLPNRISLTLTGRHPRFDAINF
jgi:hypothetical protein